MIGAIYIANTGQIAIARIEIICPPGQCGFIVYFVITTLRFTLGGSVKFMGNICYVFPGS